MSQAQTDIDTHAGRLRKFIRAERSMRVQVFARDPGKRRSKVAECDQALASVEELAKAAQAVEQGSLFT